MGRSTDGSGPSLVHETEPEPQQHRVEVEDNSDNFEQETIVNDDEHIRKAMGGMTVGVAMLPNIIAGITVICRCNLTF